MNIYYIDLILENYNYLYHDYFRGSVLEIGIRLPTPLFIIVNIMISKNLNNHIMHCHNITLFTKFQRNVFNIE